MSDNTRNMQEEQIQKILFVINPISGGKLKQDWEAFIRDYFKSLPHSIEFYILTGKDDSSSINHYIERLAPDKVVGVGGDGTIKLIAELLHGKDIAIGILPAGSANGMAKELNIPLAKEAALDVVLNGEKKQTDVIQVNDEEICLHLSDFGLNAMLVHYFENSNKRGMIGYAQGVLKMLWNKRKLHATITTDDDTFKRKAYMIVLANASKYGTGATINPEGKIDDGLFEVVIIRRLNFWGLLNMLIAHNNFNKEKIEIVSTKSVKISLLYKSHFQVDGEYRGKTKTITAKVLSGCLNIMLPVPETQKSVA
ncbi:MAG TPA: diacylglycerol kinase family protein [Chitinophagaceae bacterium]|jgi:YegS/Rv2252/BmrU family lipid kinase|nr:diacylglycerol kinase family protein [Chitinophagaceae bacterium]